MRESSAKHVNIASRKLVYFVCFVHMYLLHVVVGGCYSNPCTNGGTCVPVAPDTYSCQCLENLSGTNCDETEFSGFKYLIVDKTQDWETARDKCIERGYNLTSIMTIPEMDFLGSFVG